MPPPSSSSKSRPKGAKNAARYDSLADPETLRLFVEHLDAGIYITDAEGRFLDANPAFLSLVGLTSKEELAELRVSDLLVEPERRNELLAMLDEQGSVRDFETEIVRRDGSVRTLSDTTYLVRDPKTNAKIYHGIVVDVTHAKELEAQLRSQVTRDPLTGCYNRRYLLELSERTREGGDALGSWGCIFVDIDRLKTFNDTYGHQRGDEMLQRMARFLMSHVRANEPVIRFGGDEFLVVLVGADAARTEDVVKRLRNAAARSAAVPFSLGWAARAPDESLEDTVNRANRKLLDVRVLSRSGEVPRLPDEMERRKRS
ncbi:MAG TPA: sensor domain-containing diguanylate cyclase [Gemmatimonadaceae bacterium]|nr:sensor domain-containing diguanylate cyclase [Gemmatimonadaceae bacterium]